ncbi:MAG TPA: DUF554 domain-containing protein [Limnochordia bacterium]|nr:DUF554 domain-containing protein [Limnochordia bacterium]
MALWGSIVNAVAIIAGALLGSVIRLSERVGQTILQALALAVLIIGISMGLQSGNILIPIAALAIGSIVGEQLDLEGKIEHFGETMRRATPGRIRLGSSHTDFTQGFLTATLVYCVGAMAVVGSLNSGLSGDHQVLYAKALLDGTTAILFTASLGLGVAFSAVPVLVYQGTIALLAKTVAPLLSGVVIQELTATGGMLILGIGLNMLGLTKLRLGNMLPAVLVAALLALFWA